MGMVVAPSNVGHKQSDLYIKTLNRKYPALDHHGSVRVFIGATDLFIRRISGPVLRRSARVFVDLLMGGRSETGSACGGSVFVVHNHPSWSISRRSRGLPSFVLVADLKAAPEEI